MKLVKKILCIPVISITILVAICLLCSFSEPIKTLDFDDFLKVYEYDYVKWVDQPKTDKDFYDNFLYCFIRGDWDFDTSGMSLTGYVWHVRAKEIARTRCDSMGYFINQRFDLGIKDGKCFIYTYGYEPPLTKDQIMEQLVKGYETAKSISAKLHKKKKIREGMSELAIAKVCADYLLSQPNKETPTYSIQLANANKTEFTPADSFPFMSCDSSYACLVDQSADCGGRAAGYNLLTHVEGLHTMGLGVEYHGGHIDSFAELDGKYYLIDWGNRLGVFPFDEMEKYGVSERPEDADYVRRAIDFYNSGRFGKDEIIFIFPKLDWEYLRTEKDYKVYFVKFADENFDTGDIEMFRLCYGEEGNAIGGTRSVDNLRKGVEFRANINSIMEHNLKENFFLKKAD